MNASAWFASVGFDYQLSGRLCMTLAHSLWQVGLLAVSATLICRLCRRDNPERDYAVHVTALLLGLAALPITFALIDVPAQLIAVTDPPAAVAESQVAPLSATQQPGQSAEFNLSIPTQREDLESRVDIPLQLSAGSWLFRMAPWLAGCYAVGVLLMILRLGRGIWQSHQLATHATPITTGSLHQLLHTLARTLSLRIVPALAQAQGIVVPQVVGLLRPTILLPTSALTGLTPEELEMILVHELAHVRRFDMWVNLMQRLAETLLFFNPGLWHLSRRISTYREYCCDEQTCHVASREPSTTRLRYAQALLHVVELSGKAFPQGELTALAATGSRPSELRRRVARLFGEPLREPVRMSRGGLLVLIVGLALLLVGPVSWQTAAEPVKKVTEKAPVDKREMLVKVVDAEGQPIEGAKVFRNHAYYEIDGERSQFENDTYYTDARGNAVIPLSGRTRILRIWAGKQGFVPQFANWEKETQTDGDQIPAKFEFRLNRGTRIAGLVTNVAGIPIEGVRVEVEDRVATWFSMTPNEPQPGQRPVRESHLAHGSAGVRTDSEGRWSLENVPPDNELVFQEDDLKRGPKTPLSLRFSHPDYDTIDGIEDWQSIPSPPLQMLRDGTARTVMKWVNKDDRGRVNAVRLEQGQQYRNADFSGRYFKSQELITWSDNMLAGSNLSDSTWEDMEIPGISGLLCEADCTEIKLNNVQVTGQMAGMQKTIFDRALLESADLRSGVSGFQEATFDGAIIINSYLEGGGSAFQGASFKGTTLQSSMLKGAGPAFQMASFDDAKLVKTSIACDSPTAFQGVSLNNTKFSESDLSTIDAQALGTCKFDSETPPRYDAATKFPEGFDPAENGWKQIK